ncbi:AMP-binding protein [Plantactinospora sp. KBS50]|uniref:AMP-binding protein n=1 Tax=Plantactinospora sp. KBS50 TaxID=2024580 RepID=UPI000BAAE1E1|nr:AMP-binding protein [Plantactinospora sp. KBS50]ASW54769.1 D-alanine--poly(phosphoribitol) ligase [Plantactinospora sp. KBS50]
MTGRTLYQWFVGTALRQPELIAVEGGGATLSYGQLHRAAESLAARILRRHGAAPARVALLAGRGPVACAGYLAALRLGAAVTPVNPGYPVLRNRAVVDLAEADVLLADEDVGQAGELGPRDGSTVTVAVAELTDPAGPAPLPPYRGNLDDPAYVLFTSGSTGRPKGVPISHRSADAYVAHNVARYEVGPGCRMSHTFDLTFDPSVFDLFVTWGGGATLVVPGPGDLLSPVDHVRRTAITHWFSVPSVVSVATEMGRLGPGYAPSLRQSTFIGEPFTLDQAAAWRAATGGGHIDNVYGPTELTVACSEYRLPERPGSWPTTSNGTVPIGRMYPLLDWVLLDASDGVAAGTEVDEGELCVRGVQRFGGYLDPSDNPGRFVRDGDGPPATSDYYRTGDRVRVEHGELVHLGRLDNQVKVRGYRVELGEVEHALRGHPDVSQAIVIAVEYGGELELAGCFTGRDVSTRQLGRWLRQRVPVHMVPRRLVRLDAIPLNPNGKADRGRIRELMLAGAPARSRS